MKAVILAGGRGTRISEESTVRPKPMIEIGGKPIIWHIMKIYSKAGINDFIICAGYKGFVIKEYFANYFIHTSDITFDICKNEVTIHERKAEPWRVTIVDTGSDTMTGGRLKRIAPYLGDDDFCMTYGDGVADVDVRKVIDFHRNHGKEATVMSVRPQGRFGVLNAVNDGTVTGFVEKPTTNGNLINAGFFVLSKKALDQIENDGSIWEREPMERLLKRGQLMAYRHNGFWQAMDTMRDKAHLEELWESEAAPWKIW